MELGKNMPVSNLGARLKLHVQDLMMRFMDELRHDTVSRASGTVLEVGFGTGRNLTYYTTGVEKVVGVDPMSTRGMRTVDRRIERTPFPVELVLTASGELPFEAGHFDCIVTTWTLCSMTAPLETLAEMRRVLKPGGRYFFVEHGRSRNVHTARWQDRLNPVWRKLMDGCNINRRIDHLIREAGLSVLTLDRFQCKGPRLLTCMYRGIGTAE